MPKWSLGPEFPSVCSKLTVGISRLTSLETLEVETISCQEILLTVLRDVADTELASTALFILVNSMIGIGGVLLGSHNLLLGRHLAVVSGREDGQKDSRESLASQPSNGDEAQKRGIRKKCDRKSRVRELMNERRPQADTGSPQALSVAGFKIRPSTVNVTSLLRRAHLQGMVWREDRIDAPSVISARHWWLQGYGLSAASRRALAVAAA
jgi:hypothetical protein